MCHHTEVSCNASSDQAHFDVQPLEQRMLLSVTWSSQAQLIHEDLATKNYPRINGAGQTIVIIDDGTDYSHPWLGGSIGRRAKIIDAYDFDKNSSNPFPSGSDSHGTASAFVAAGSPENYGGVTWQGVAPGANIVALRCSPASSKSALDWVISHQKAYNIVAINLMQWNPLDCLSDLQTLYNAGVFVGTASGNGGNALRDDFSIGHIVFSGSVSSSGKVSSFSQIGSAVQMMAPGEHMAVPWSVGPLHVSVYADGTSWSTAQVVGAAALIKQVNPAFTPSQVLAILRDSGKQIKGPDGSTYPILDVNAAIALAVQRSSARGRAGGTTTTTTTGGTSLPITLPINIPKLPFSTGGSIDLSGLASLF